MHGVAALFLAVSALTGAPRAEAAAIVYTNDVLGELEPCGCRSNPTGGIARKAEWLKRQGDQELLQLDAGDLLFESAEIPDALREQAELQARYLLQAHDLLKHDAFVPGEKDFALGVQVFDRLRSKSKAKFLAANLIRSNGRAFLQPHAIFVRKDQDGKKLRIAVLGLVGKNVGFPKGLKVTPPIDAAKKWVPMLRKQADVVVALTHQGLEEDRALAAAVKGIDIIIGSHTQSFLQEPQQVEKTRIYQSSFRNQYVGFLPLARKQSGEGHTLTALDESWLPQSPGPVDRLVAEFKTRVARLNATKSSGDHASASSNHYQTLPKCAGCHVAQLEFWRKTPHANAFATLVDAKQHLNKDCIRCHSLAFGQKTGFSEFTSIFKEPARLPDGRTPVELAHHYIEALRDAPAKPAAELRRLAGEATQVWVPVQCENCHAPGGEHPFSSSYTKEVKSESCLKCHTADRAPGWYKNGKLDDEIVAAKRKRVTCPAGLPGDDE